MASCFHPWGPRAGTAPSIRLLTERSAVRPHRWRCLATRYCGQRDPRCAWRVSGHDRTYADHYVEQIADTFAAASQQERAHRHGVRSDVERLVRGTPPEETVQTLRPSSVAVQLHRRPRAVGGRD